jgi:hypothetical protein
MMGTDLCLATKLDNACLGSFRSETYEICIHLSICPLPVGMGSADGLGA